MGIVQVQKDDARKLKDIADILASAKRIIVVTGAGISTSCGIPVSSERIEIQLLRIGGVHVMYSVF